MNLRDEFDELTETLARERDQLRVSAHLLGAELRDEWEKTEEKWEDFQNKARNIKNKGQETASKTLHASKDLGQEIHAAYKRFRDAL